MKLNLESLCNNMKSRNELRCKFPFSFRNKDFLCIFIIDCSPWLLYIFTLGDNPLSIEVTVGDDFSITTKLDGDDYTKLCNYLELRYDPNNRFMPSVFFEGLNLNIPSHFTQKPDCRETMEAIRNARDIEENDKIFFIGTRHNAPGKHTTEYNYEKTKFAFGDKVANNLKRLNISTCWSDENNAENLALLNDMLCKYQ